MKYVALSALFLFALDIHAECAFDVYSFSGVVTSSASPVAGAVVVVTFDQPGHAPPELPASATTALSETAKTDREGRYRINMKFDPISTGGVSARQCANKLTFVTVSISAVGYEPLMQEQPISGLLSTADYSLKRAAASRHGAD